jgi:hypothetical protein
LPLPAGVVVVLIGVYSTEGRSFFFAADPCLADVLPIDFWNDIAVFAAEGNGVVAMEPVG